MRKWLQLQILNTLEFSNYFLIYPQFKYSGWNIKIFQKKTKYKNLVRLKMDLFIAVIKIKISFNSRIKKNIKNLPND